MEEGYAAEEAARSVAHPAEGRRLQIKTLRRKGTRVAAASPLRRRPGLTGRPQTSDFVCPEKDRGRLPFKGKTDVAWPRTRLLPNIVAAELPRTEGGLGLWGLGTLGTQASASVRPHSDPHRQPHDGSTAT